MILRSAADREILRRADEIKRAEKSARPARPKAERKVVGHVNLKADRGRVRDPGFLAFLRRQPCAVRGRNGHVCEGRIEAAHIRTHKPGEPPTGLQRKPSDRRATGLCSLAHRQQHETNEARWWASYGLDPFAVAETLFAAYQAEAR